ncbi:MAG: MCE family protein [Draconibacterium sp.]|nr:MCE family protein [Draconibacterium sp.]
MKLSKYTKLGLLIIISTTIFIWGLSYLKGNDIFKQNNAYHIVYERVDGLVESSKVTMNGYQIGQVKSINFAPDNSGKLIVTFIADATFRIPLNSVAQIVSSDIMGTRSIKMIFSNEDEVYLAYDTIPGAVETDLKEQVSLQILPIKNKAEQLLGTIDSAITVLTIIFNEDAQQNLSTSFANINQTIENIEKTTADIQSIVSSEKGSIKNIITNIEEITLTFNNNSKALETTIQNLASFSDTLAQFSISPILANISLASEQILIILQKLNSEESTAGLLLNDDELYKSINDLSDNLSFLITDIQANPKRYLQFSAMDFGKEYYINANTEGNSKNIIFKVHLISAENQIPTNSKYFEGIEGVEEFVASGAYSYLVGASASYSEIVVLHDEIKKKFPESTIVSFKNGRLIKLEKALKSLH